MTGREARVGGEVVVITEKRFEAGVCIITIAIFVVRMDEVMEEVAR